MKILFLEDEINTAEVLCEYFNADGFEVKHVKDGNEALNLITKEKFDLAVLDINVYGISGLEVLKTIKERNIILPVIMLSAITDEYMQIEAFEFYADDYITKPFSPRLLLKRCETVLRRYNNQVINIKSGLYIDNDSYSVYYDRVNLNFTLTEFYLFKTLYSNPGKVYTRSILLDIIYSNYSENNDRVIDAHIKNIRKKLPNEKQIVTVIGIGYKFEGENHD